MKLIRFSIAILAITLVFASCKKDKDKDAGASIVGTWTLSQYGSDDNNNNVADASELASFATLGLSGTITFNSNNTFTAVSAFGGSTSTESGTYTYSGNTLTTTSNGSSDAVTVNTLTSNKLIIKDGSSTPADWTVLTR